jgi:hypothetical protein
LIKTIYQAAKALVKNPAYYYANIPTYPGGGIGFMYVSNTPWQNGLKTPLPPGVNNYINPDIQRAAFALPEFLEKNCMGKVSCSSDFSHSYGNSQTTDPQGALQSRYYAFLRSRAISAGGISEKLPPSPVWQIADVRVEMRVRRRHPERSRFGRRYSLILERTVEI